MIKFLIRSEISNGDKKRTSALIIFQNKSLKDSYYSLQEKRQCYVQRTNSTGSFSSVVNIGCQSEGRYTPA